MDLRIAEALVTLESMISPDCLSSIDEEERIEYEQRVGSIAKNWCFLPHTNMLPNPREIARYGWKLSASSTLECKTCHTKLKIDHNGLTVVGGEDSSLLKEYMHFGHMQFDEKLKQIGMLRYSHKSHCSFALIEIPLSYEAVYATPDRLSAFRNDFPVSSPPACYCYRYYYSLLQEKQYDYKLPLLSQQTLSAIETTLQKRSQPSGSIMDYDQFRDPKAIFALTGWKLTDLYQRRSFESGDILNKREQVDPRFTLFCEWCHRTVGNWNFQCSNEEDIQLVKKQKTSETTEENQKLPAFDALGQHLEFCPWVHSIDDEKAAWKQILEFYCLPTQEDSTLTLQAEEGYGKLIKALN